MGYEPHAPRNVSWATKSWYRFSYMGHLAGVLMVNPNRAYVQGRALMRQQAPEYRAAADTAAKS